MDLQLPHTPARTNTSLRSANWEAVTHSRYVCETPCHVVRILTPADIKVRPTTGTDAPISRRSRWTVTPWIFGRRPGDTRKPIDGIAGDRFRPIIAASVRFGDNRSTEKRPRSDCHHADRSAISKRFYASKYSVPKDKQTVLIPALLLCKQMAITATM